jgi:hypothetical protein
VDGAKNPSRLYYRITRNICKIRTRTSMDLYLCRNLLTAGTYCMLLLAATPVWPAVVVQALRTRLSDLIDRCDDRKMAKAQLLPD